MDKRISTIQLAFPSLINHLYTRIYIRKQGLLGTFRNIHLTECICLLQTERSRVRLNVFQGFVVLPIRNRKV
jgi:hypothetical protein